MVTFKQLNNYKKNAQRLVGAEHGHGRSGVAVVWRRHRGERPAGGHRTPPRTPITGTMSSSGDPQKTRRVSSNLCRSASASLGHLDRRRGDGTPTMSSSGGGGSSSACDDGPSAGNDGIVGGGGQLLRRHQSTEFGSLSCLHRPRTLMEALLIAKMERASLNGGAGHQYGSHPSLVRTDSIGSTSSLDSMSSMNSDVCRCDDCLLGIADLLYINTFAYEGRRRKVRRNCPLVQPC